MTPTAIGSSTAQHQNVDAASASTPTAEQKKAARDFEAIFLRQLLSSLEKSSGLAGGESSGGQVFRSMMVGALADTASEGGGIGLSEVILKAMLPPSPGVTRDLAHPSSSPRGGSTTQSDDRGPSAEGAESVRRGELHHGGVGEPSSSARWGAASRVLTEARGATMLGGATVSVAAAGEGHTPGEGSGR